MSADVSAGSRARRWPAIHVSVLAWVVVVGAFVHPPGGMGVPICPSKLLADVPCPGCGLTRSVSCAARLDVARSVRYNAFGPVVLGMAVVVAGASVLPGRRREVLRGRYEASGRPRAAVGGVLLMAYIAFGVARAIVGAPGV